MSQNPMGYFNLSNLKALEALQEAWLLDPKSVDPSWQYFFEGMAFSQKLPEASGPSFQKDLKLDLLIDAYRTYGHLYAFCNVLQEKPPFPEELTLSNFGFTSSDLALEFDTPFFQAKTKLADILEALQSTYCQTIGIEYMGHCPGDIQKWIQSKIEPFFPCHLSEEEKVEIFIKLNQAEEFEAFLHTKYVGQKRFSLEGAESLIPLLYTLLKRGGELGVKKGVIGMAHRGRLNVLANIMGKSYQDIFKEFEDGYVPDLVESTGDVKYHMGFTGEFDKMQLILSANPSHLESVDAVVEGQVRALQEQQEKGSQSQVLPLLIHGDAALAGQGVVYETLMMSKLNGYKTFGTIHVVINNQIGFTTPAQDGRSTRYCTDIAKTFEAPILHVNGEDPDACAKAAMLAIELRQKFGCDVFIDLMGYRKYGHNEGDEPNFTQPLPYQIIKKKEGIRKLYKKQLISQNILSPEKAEKIEQSFKEDLLSILKEVKSKPPINLTPRKAGRQLPELLAPYQTAIDKKTLLALGEKITKLEGVKAHPKIEKLFKERLEMLQQDNTVPTIDWGMAEILAYASLCTQKIHIRLSGQDVRRGTFSHRHGLVVDQETSSHYFPLSHLDPEQAPCDLFNSFLSEMAVLGFEFGYSLLYPNSLVLWEAQYGDFANGAQIIVDQYLASSEMKWKQTSNLTLLLPHGYEGGGPEHSSARIERFLQLCGDENFCIANCTTPAQFFHLIRRQALRPIKKPLVVFTPKAILRYRLCKSPLEAFYNDGFHEILEDPIKVENPERILLCSGKIYFELVQEKEKRKALDVILRIEQLYPLHEEKLKQLFEKAKGAKECIWVQEEAENMGAWLFMQPLISRLLDKKMPLRYVGRQRSAAPAVGSHALHELEHTLLMQQLYS